MPSRRHRSPATVGAALLILILLAAVAVPAAAPAAKLKKPGGAKVTKVTTGKIKLVWKDRTRGERYQRIEYRESGAPEYLSRRVKRDRTKAKVKGLRAGLVHEIRVRACRGKRCSKPSKKIRTATLLAPFGGPHPDPGCNAFPVGESFNRDISADPVDPSSDAIIDRINADGGDSLHPDFGSNPSYGIPYVVVPASQPLVPIRFTAFGDESDPGPYPIPPGAPIEGGRNSDGDRHVLVLRRPSSPGTGCELFELYRSFEQGNRKGTWEADSGAIFDLGAPLVGQRPDGWTSADAAGLPIFPGLVTKEEVDSGEIDHAIRITFAQTRREYLSPATHFASSDCHPNRPPMGMRLRLKAGYDISGVSGDARVIAEALKTYGAIVADNGSNWFITGSTDSRWDDDDLGQLKGIPGSAFEVVSVLGTTSTDDC